MIAKSRYIIPVGIMLFLGSCLKSPQQGTVTEHLCPNANPVVVYHDGADSALYYIPNCFTPGDSSSVNDSLTEYSRNIAQAVVTITDSSNNIVAYDSHSFQYPGFSYHKVWDGNNAGSPSGEGCYLVTVNGVTMFGNRFTVKGTVSLLRYFFGNDSLKVKTPVFVHCDSCFFNSQWSGTNFNPRLSSGEHFVQDATHQCY